MSSKIWQDDSIDSNVSETNDDFIIEPLPGLEAIFEQLLKEDGYG